MALPRHFMNWPTWQHRSCRNPCECTHLAELGHRVLKRHGRCRCTFLARGQRELGGSEGCR